MWLVPSEREPSKPWLEGMARGADGLGTEDVRFMPLGVDHLACPALLVACVVGHADAGMCPERAVGPGCGVASTCLPVPFA